MTIYLVYTMAMLVITMDVIDIYIYIYKYVFQHEDPNDGWLLFKKAFDFPDENGQGNGGEIPFLHSALRECDSFLQIALYSPQVSPKIC